MTDRIVASGWWIFVMGIVAATAIAAVMLSYSGLLELISQNWGRGALAIVAGAVTGTAGVLLCRHRADLLV